MAYESMMTAGTPTPLEAAEAMVRAYCEWHVAPIVDETLTLDAKGGTRLFLPSLRVVSVAAVRVSGGLVDPSGYDWTEDGVLRRLGGAQWPYAGRSVEVDLVHGHEPAEVAWIVAQIAERITSAPDRATIIGQLSVGTRQITYRPGAGMVSLLGPEREALEPYKIRRGADR